MKLKTAYVRFYRAFNFDYLRKRDPRSEPNAWDVMPDETFYPYVKVDIDPEITCVVGANESGKSQLLQAVECGLGTQEPSTADFCRYSEYFTVAEAMKLPHFGLHFSKVTEVEQDALIEAAELDAGTAIESFRLFRTASGQATIYLDDDTPHAVTEMSAIEELLPRVFRIDPQIAIPNSVPIAFLAEGGEAADADPGPARSDRWSLVDPVINNSANLFAQLGDATKFGATIQNLVSNIEVPSGLSDRERKSHNAELNLAFALLVNVGGIHLSAFNELQDALRNDDEGLANGIVAAMNEQLEERLNLTRWWSQDKHFSVAIAVRDFDIVFTIRDKTGSEYSFAERSGGLKYFLSYLVQFLAHVRTRERSEILLMDEPDAFLSNQGQQDLLRVFKEFVLPDGEGVGGQVIFVTHSPFLIDKNRADRIRVLDKGSGDEGVRVVRDVGHNHFEPLRTALGSFVGETAFISNCNLMLEGITDQVYLAGISGVLQRRGSFAATQFLDLNRLTLVPSGSATHVPYMTFLARGRDADKPAVIVLLDGDKEGDEAVKTLKRGGPKRKQLLKDEYILQLKPNAIDGLASDRPSGPVDIEDLVPVKIGLDAARRFIDEMELEIPEKFPTETDVIGLLDESTGVLQAIQTALANAGSSIRLEKLGFARHVVAVVSDGGSSGSEPILDRFALLFTHLNSMQRLAERERSRESIVSRVDREKRLYLRDKSGKHTKSGVSLLLERIEGTIDQSIEGDALLTEIRRLREEFALDENTHLSIENEDSLVARLEALQYAEVLASQPSDSDSNRGHP